MSTQIELNQRLQSAQSDVAYWVRKYEGKPTYHYGRQLYYARVRLERVETEIRFELKTKTCFIKYGTNCNEFPSSPL